jgi:hypothetical protein
MLMSHPTSYPSFRLQEVGITEMIWSDSLVHVKVDVRTSQPPSTACILERLDLNSRSKEDLQIDYSSPFVFLTLWKFTDVIESLPMPSQQQHSQLERDLATISECLECFFGSIPSHFPQHARKAPCLSKNAQPSRSSSDLPRRPSEQALGTFHQKFEAFEERFSVPKIQRKNPQPQQIQSKKTLFLRHTQ